MDTARSIRFILCLLLTAIILSCELRAVERETSVEGSVQLTTGEPVENYPLSIVAKKGTFFGVSNLVSRQDMRTDKQGRFSYKGMFKSSGQGYELEYAQSFKFNNDFYSVDTIQATIPNAGINVTSTYRFDGYLFAGKQHTIQIFLKKDQ